MTSGRAVFGTASRFHKAQKQPWADRTAEAKPYSDALVGPKAPAFTIGVRYVPCAQSNLSLVVSSL